jgi:hypothetical protein
MVYLVGGSCAALLVSLLLPQTLCLMLCMAWHGMARTCVHIHLTVIVCYDADLMIKHTRT